MTFSDFFKLEDEVRELKRRVRHLERLAQVESVAGQDDYDRSYGDAKICTCGHTYYRHFDTHDNMAPVGCKYCPCGEFTLATRRNT
jgi:hypothetical protein